jgi:glycine/D-amino acid oxidase-like deaminating enzyme
MTAIPSALSDGLISAALASAQPGSFWLQDQSGPTPEPGLGASLRCDLAVVGGGYSGLWTALRAKERDPATRVVLLEARRVGWAASGRNGGFCAASLTHGYSNGLARFPDELAQLHRLGRENLDGIAATLARYGLDAEFERSGELTVAVRPWQVEALREEVALRPAQDDVRLLDEAAVRAEVHSPTYLAAVRDPAGSALVHPAKLAWELKRACLSAGAEIFEHTPVIGLERDSAGVVLRTDHGRVSAAKVALATNVFPSLLRRVRPFIVPVYDYVLVTEPLSPDQLAGIGWRSRQGIADAGNQFHYYRLTADNRILWGGYDAVYYFGKRVRDEYDHRVSTYRRLARHFFTTFPQLAGLRFSHRWGGAVDASTRFCVFFGTAMGNRVAYAAGYTGLGVGASRFGADVMLDLLDGRPTERTELQMVRSRPKPFPPEPVSYLGIQATRWSLDQADRHHGRRNAWLRALDRLGVGFDS